VERTVEQGVENDKFKLASHEMKHYAVAETQHEPVMRLAKALGNVLICFGWVRRCRGARRWGTTAATNSGHRRHLGGGTVCNFTVGSSRCDDRAAFSGATECKQGNG